MIACCEHWLFAGEGVDCQLVVAGDGPEKESLMALTKQLGLDDSVVWLGPVAHDDIWALMNNADAFMLTNDVTNRCNPLYEAAWAGLPVISVQDPSTGDLLQHGENALLADKEDTQALGKCLVEVCRDDTLRKKLGQAQKALSATFWTWEERMKAEVKELEALVSPACPAGGGHSMSLKGLLFIGTFVVCAVGALFLPHLGIYGYIADYCINPSDKWWAAPFSRLGSGIASPWRWQLWLAWCCSETNCGSAASFFITRKLSCF